MNRLTLAVSPGEGEKKNPTAGRGQDRGRRGGEKCSREPSLAASAPALRRPSRASSAAATCPPPPPPRRPPMTSSSTRTRRALPRRPPPPAPAPWRPPCRPSCSRVSSSTTASATSATAVSARARRIISLVANGANDPPSVGIRLLRVWGCRRWRN